MPQILEIENLPTIYSAWRARYEDRDVRTEIIHDIVSGNWRTYDTDEEELENRSANLIQVALEDTAEAGAQLPTLRVRPRADQKRAKKAASKMERIGMGYMEASKWDLLMPQTILQMGATGLGVWTITPDYEQRIPLLELRDSRTCYPEPGYRPGDPVRRCMFIRNVYASQLPVAYQEKLNIELETNPDSYNVQSTNDIEIALVEWYDEYEYVLAGIVTTGTDNYLGGGVSFIPIEFDREPHGLPVCPVVIGARFTLDGEFRGQFDQVVKPLLAHARLLGTLLDYSDQAVYCLAPDTQVLTQDLEYVPVGDLLEGDLLAGFDEEPTDGYRKWATAKVTATGRKRLLSKRVTLADGTVITASDDHRWLTGNSSHKSTWQLTRHLRPGISRIVRLADVWEPAETYEAGYLAGVMDGEGWLSLNGKAALRCGIAQRDNACLHQTEAALAHLGFKFTKTMMSASEDNPGGPVFNLQIEGGTAEILRLLGTVRPQRLIDKFQALGGFDLNSRLKRQELVLVDDVEDVGEVEVVTLATSTGTLVAEGFAHHNSDVWVKDLIGEMSWGGGGFIKLGPQGQIGRVPPAVSSLDVQRDLDHLEEAIHKGGRYPKSRPGEVDQSIVSAKGIEAMAGVMNTALRTYHQILRHMLEAAVRIAFQMDAALFPGTKSFNGVLRNQEFLIDYDPRTDIDLKAHVRFEYGIGLGRTASETAVLLIQYHTNKMISKESTQESIDGITDVERERARQDAEILLDVMWNRLIQLSEAGQLPPDALNEMMKRRLAGEPIDELYEEYVVKPQQETQAGAIDPGLGMGPVGPDGVPLPPELGGGGPGAPGAVPEPPSGAGLLARLGVPAGPSGRLGSEVLQRGG